MRIVLTATEGATRVGHSAKVGAVSPYVCVNGSPILYAYDHELLSRHDEEPCMNASDV
jgi:hypothetical protein